MAFKEVESSFATPWNPQKKGEQLIGTYCGSEEVPSGRVLQGGEREFFTSWRIRNEEGRYIGISGAMLRNKFNQVPEGSIVRLTYQGKIKTGQGQAKDFLLEVDEDTDLLDPFAPNANAMGGNAQESRATA